MKENNVSVQGTNNFQPMTLGKVNADARPYPVLHKSDNSRDLIYNNLQEVGQGIAEPSFGE